jgi:hypothetical protein
MKFMSAIMTIPNPSLARQIRTAIWMDKADLTFDPKNTITRYPQIILTKMKEAIRRDYGKLIDVVTPSAISQ